MFANPLHRGSLTLPLDSEFLSNRNRACVVLPHHYPTPLHPSRSSSFFTLLVKHEVFLDLSDQLMFLNLPRFSSFHMSPPYLPPP